MCATIDGLRTLTKALLDAKPWEVDPDCARMPWSEDAYQLRDHGGEQSTAVYRDTVAAEQPKLAFGLMWHDGHVMPDPPYRRALDMVKSALLKAGHEVYDWEPYRCAESHALGVGTSWVPPRMTYTDEQKRIYNVSGDVSGSPFSPDLTIAGPRE
jgi:amidase